MCSLRLNRVVFLDVDGVLNSKTHGFLHGFGDTLKVNKDGDLESTKLSLEMFNLLNTLCFRSKASVVMTTSWRTEFHGSNPEFWNQLFKKMANSQNNKSFVNVVGVTQDLSLNKLERGDEVRLWLNENDWVDEFVLLDDLNDCWFPSQLHRLVNTDDMHGLSLLNLKEALELFNLDTNFLSKFFDE